MSGFELGMAMRQNLQCIPILNTKYMTDFNKFMPLPEKKTNLQLVGASNACAKIWVVYGVCVVLLVNL